MTISGIKAPLVGLVGAACLAPMILFAGAAPARADTNCGSSPGDLVQDVEVRSASWSNRTVVLLTGRWSDHSYAWVKNGYSSGDLTWVDRSYNGGTNWTQCGPFQRRSSNDLLNEGNWMRACMRVTSAAHSFCTGWYYDHPE